MRGVTLCQFGHLFNCNISTHTPHARRDMLPLIVLASHNISTHTPHARRDELSLRLGSDHLEFLLTRLMRGVTREAPPRFCVRFHFYSHASCEA